MTKKKPPAIGQAYGLAWTPDATNLIHIKAYITKPLRGVGNLFVEGDIGDEVLNQVHTVCHILAHSDEFDITKKDMLLSIPGPLDGPSAGLPIFLALYSALAKKPINQSLAFTGALNDDGAILPVEAIKDKLLAVYRAKLKGLVLPMDNMADLSIATNQWQWGDTLICPVVRVADALVLAAP